MTPAEAKIARQIGKLLKEARTSRDWLQEVAARKLGVGRSTLANIERGERPGRKVLTHLDTVYPDVAQEVRRLFRELADGSATTEGPDAVTDDHAQAEITEVFRRRREVRPTLGGTWHAIWQTTVDDEEVINTEELDTRWKGDVLLVRNLEPSPENPKGGYLWIAKMELFDNSHLLGRYVPVEPDILSKGTLFLTLHNSGRFMYGRWVGCNYDAEVATGAALFSRNRDELFEGFEKYCVRTVLPPQSIPKNRKESK